MKHKLAAVLTTAAIASFSLIPLAVDSAIAETSEKGHVLKPVFSVSYLPTYYKWNEPGVEEEGWIHELEVGLSLHPEWVPLKTELNFAIYGGEVDYDGYTWGGTSLSTNVNYNGWRAGLKVGYPLEGFPLEEVNLFPYAFITYDTWHRSLDTITSAIGYTEEWRTWFTGVGVKSEFLLPDGFSLYVDVAVNYSFGATNEVDLFDVEVDPEEDWGYRIEAGVKKNRVSISAFYERDEFDPSGAEYSGVVGGYVYQPDSVRKLAGFRIMIKF